MAGLLELTSILVFKREGSLEGARKEGRSGMKSEELETKTGLITSAEIGMKITRTTGIRITTGEEGMGAAEAEAVVMAVAVITEETKIEVRVDGRDGIQIQQRSDSVKVDIQVKREEVLERGLIEWLMIKDIKIN
jgi:hypothetical protein